MLSQDSVRVLTFSTDFTTTESTININFQLDTVKKKKQNGAGLSKAGRGRQRVLVALPYWIEGGCSGGGEIR